MSRPIHRRWLTWVGLALMLAALGIYVLTLDDSLEDQAAERVEQNP